MKKTTLFLAALFCGAACANSDNGVNQIVSVGIHESGHALIVLAGSTNTEGCARSDMQKVVVINKNNTSFNYMYAIALTAQAAGRPISGWVNGCTDPWGNGTNVVTAITLYMN